MKDEIMSLLTDYGELTLDMFLRDGIIKELPIVGSTFSMIKISADIRDRIFLEKLKSFIENIEKNTKWQEKFSDIEECSTKAPAHPVSRRRIPGNTYPSLPPRRAYPDG